jgi:hypothetical protein
MKKRKTTVRGVRLREKNGRARRVSQRDHGTPELLARKLAMSAACEAQVKRDKDEPKGKRWFDVSASGLDMLWRTEKINASEWSAGKQFQRLYRLCSAAPGLRSGAATGGLVTDLTEDQARLRRMQQSLTRDELERVTEVCGLMLYPGWLLRPSRERRELVRGLKVLDKGVRG